MYAPFRSLDAAITARQAQIARELLTFFEDSDASDEGVAFEAPAIGVNDRSPISPEELERLLLIQLEPQQDKNDLEEISVGC